MKCEDTKERFPDFLTGDLDPRAKSEFDAHIAACASCGEELRRLSEIWTKLGVLPVEQPSNALRDRFYTMLEAYKDGLEAERRKAEAPPKRRPFFSLERLWPRRPAFQFAAALVLVIAGIGGGYFLRSSGVSVARLDKEVSDLRQMAAVSLLQQSSATERLRGVSVGAQLKQPGKNMLDALLQTLDGDPNVNVRLAAVDALYLFASNPDVKEGILQSLTRQESPSVQTALIDLLVEIRERRAVDALKSLIGNEKIVPEVKKKAEFGIQQLSF